MAKSPSMVVGELEIRPTEYLALAGGRPLQLTVRELDVLTALAERRDRIVSREELYQAVREEHYRKTDRSVDVYVARLRHKLDEALPGRAYGAVGTAGGAGRSPVLTDSPTATTASANKPSIGKAKEYTFHPLAALFPLIEGGEYATLVEDIRQHGLNEPIVIHEDMILDGRNRYRACFAAGIEPTFRRFQGDDPYTFVLSANVNRRHLTAEQKHGLIAKILKHQPDLSNRQIAVVAKVNDKTVAPVRVRLEATAEIPQLSKTVGADGRARPVKPRSTTKRAVKKPPRQAGALSSLAWSEAAPKQRVKFIDAIGVYALIDAMSPEQRAALLNYIKSSEAADATGATQIGRARCR